MMVTKALLVASTMAFAPPVEAGEYVPVAEICLESGECAFRIPFPGGLEQKGLHLVNPGDYETMSEALPGAHFFLANEEEYAAAKGQFDRQGYQEITLSAKAERKPVVPATTAPKPGGPLVGGTITVGDVNIGTGSIGANDCVKAGCHGKGDIHAPPKVTDGAGK